MTFNPASSGGSVTVDILGNLSHLEASLRKAEAELGKFHRSTKGTKDAVKDATNATNQMAAANDNLTRQVSGTRRALNLYRGAIATLATLGVTQFARATVRAASDVEEMRNLLRVVFGDAIRDMEEWSEATGNAVNRSRFNLLRFAGDFASFLRPLGTAQDQIAPMSQALTQLTVDLASFRNMAEADIFAKLMSGLAGETEAVRRLGIDLSVAAVEQELLANGITKSIQEATLAEKVMARYAIMMRQTTDAQGDAARTAGSFENQTKALSAEIHELQVALGEELMPLAQELLGWTIDMVKFLRSDGGLIGFVRELGTSFGDLSSDLDRFMSNPSLHSALSFLLGRDFANLVSDPPPGEDPRKEDAPSDRFRSSGTPAPITNPPHKSRSSIRSAERIQDVVNALKHQTQQLERTSRAQAQYDALQRAGIDADHARAIEIMNLAGALHDYEMAQESMNDSLRFFGGMATDVLSDLRKGSFDLEESFLRVADAIAEAAVEAAIFGEGPLASLFGVNTGGGGTGGIIGLIGQAFAGGFSEGGRIPANKFGLVGEGGEPEFVFGPAQVVPASQMGGTSRGGDFYYAPTITAGMTATDRAWLMAQLTRTRDEAVEMSLTEVRRLNATRSDAMSA